MFSGSSREVKIRKKASSRSRMASRSRVRSAIRCSRSACERASCSVIRVNAWPRIADLVTRVDVDAGVEVAAGDGVGRRGQPADRPGVLPCDQVGRGQAQGEDQAADGQQQPAQPVDGRVGLVDIHLGDQAPVLVAHRPEGRQDLAAQPVERSA